VIAGGHLDHLAVTASPMPDHTLDVDYVAAVDANEPAFIEPRFHFADGQWAKQFETPVEYIRVMGVRMNGDHVFDGYEVRSAIALNRQMMGNAWRRPSCAAKWRIGSPAELSFITITVFHKG
jgi:hypothetical protein